MLGVGALIFRRGRIVLVERGREPLKGYWSLPGGLVETGERLEAAIVREVFEETALRVKPVSMFEIFERIMPAAAGGPGALGRTEYHYVLIDFVCRVVSGDLRAGDDVSRAEWVELSRLREYKITEGTPEVIEKAFRWRKKNAGGQRS